MGLRSQYGGEGGFEPGISASEDMFPLAHQPVQSVQCTQLSY